MNNIIGTCVIYCDNQPLTVIKSKRIYYIINIIKSQLRNNIYTNANIQKLYNEGKNIRFDDIVITPSWKSAIDNQKIYIKQLKPIYCRKNKILKTIKTYTTRFISKTTQIFNELHKYNLVNMLITAIKQNSIANIKKYFHFDYKNQCFYDITSKHNEKTKWDEDNPHNFEYVARFLAKKAIEAINFKRSLTFKKNMKENPNRYKRNLAIV